MILKIKYKDFNKDDQLAILIKFSTTKEGMSVDWLEPEQTLEKKYPFMYSQREPILNRELFPVPLRLIFEPLNIPELFILNGFILLFEFILFFSLLLLFILLFIFVPSLILLEDLLLLLEKLILK